MVMTLMNKIIAAYTWVEFFQLAQRCRTIIYFCCYCHNYSASRNYPKCFSSPHLSAFHILLRIHGVKENQEENRVFTARF